MSEATKFITIIRPDFMSFCQDACRAASLNHLLFRIAYKCKDQPKEKIQAGDILWYATTEQITSEMSDAWGVCKVRKEVNALIETGLIGRTKDPNWGVNRTKHFFFGQKQCVKFLQLCEEHNICVVHLDLPVEVKHLIYLSNANDISIKCICPDREANDKSIECIRSIHQMQVIDLSDASDKSIEAITKKTTKIDYKDITERETSDASVDTSASPARTPVNENDSHLRMVRNNFPIDNSDYTNDDNEDDTPTQKAPVVKPLIKLPQKGRTDDLADNLTHSDSPVRSGDSNRVLVSQPRLVVGDGSPLTTRNPDALAEDAQEAAPRQQGKGHQGAAHMERGEKSIDGLVQGAPPLLSGQDETTVAKGISTSESTTSNDSLQGSTTGAGVRGGTTKPRSQNKTHDKDNIKISSGQKPEKPKKPVEDEVKFTDEGRILYKAWCSLFHVSVPENKAIIQAANTLADPVAIWAQLLNKTQADILKDIKDTLYTNDKNNYYKGHNGERGRGVKLYDVAREIEGWMSEQERKLDEEQRKQNGKPAQNGHSPMPAALQGLPDYTYAEPVIVLPPRTAAARR